MSAYAIVALVIFLGCVALLAMSAWGDRHG
jgi:hypothetical protein